MEPGRRVKPVFVWTGLIVAGGLLAWQAAEALQDNPEANTQAPAAAPIVATTAAEPAAPPFAVSQAAVQDPGHAPIQALATTGPCRESPRHDRLTECPGPNDQ